MRVSTVTAILTSVVFMAWMMSFHWHAPALYADVPTRPAISADASAKTADSIAGPQPQDVVTPLSSR